MDEVECEVITAHYSSNGSDDEERKGVEAMREYNDVSHNRDADNKGDAVEQDPIVEEAADGDTTLKDM